MTPRHEPPFNPWISCVVEASAGSGKTWQLSRRFLALVMAGADPTSILTATFTNKAAAEMRQRIISDAIKLGRFNHPDAAEFNGFAAEIAALAPSSQSLTIRSPEDTAKVIIANTQALKITTIDALFMQWAQRFPIETSVTIDDETLRSPWELLSGKPLQDLHDEAWLDVLGMTLDHEENRALMESISRNSPNGKIKALAKIISPLTHSDTFIWYARLLSGDEPLRLFPVDDQIPEDDQFLKTHASRFKDLISRINNAEKKSAALACLAQLDMAGLTDQKIINKSLSQLNGNTFKTAAKNGDPDYVAINAALASWSDQRKLQALNHTAKLIWTLYKARATAAHRRKIEGAKGSFADAIKGVSRLACDEAFAGGRAMAWSGIRHLMLDEFQDTSRLQWMIFERLALELLAGESRDEVTRGPRPSVFIVGDKKQSIYRFREAAPEVLDLAKEALTPKGLVTKTMSDSFRSSAAILDYVNQVFADGTLIAECPTHQPSVHVTKKHPDRFHYGSICVYEAAATLKPLDDAPSEPSEPSDSPDNGQASPQTISARTREALTVASHIKRCITGEIGVQVFDESTKTWRAPRPRDFAVLYPKSTTAELIEDALRHQDIPSVRAETKGYFARQEIQDLTALVTWLTWPADSVALCTVLRSPIIGIDDETLQKIISEGPEQILHQLQVMAPEAFALLSRLQKRHRRDTLPEMVASLIHEYQIDERYARAFGPIEGPLAKANIRKWFELTRGASADAALSAYQWWRSLDEAGTEDETGNASTASDAVVMMTIHKSKGLEFPIVIVTDTATDWHTDDTGWIKDSRPGLEGLWFIGTNKDSRPEHSATLNELRQISEDASRAEKARLLYVALTRAAQHLVITGAHKDGNTQDHQQPDAAFHGPLKAAAISMTGCQNHAIKSLSPETLPGIFIERPRLPASEDAARPASKDQDKMPAKGTPGQPSTLGTLPVKILTASTSVKTSPLVSSENIPYPNVKPSNEIPEGLASAYGTMVHKLIETTLQGINITDQGLVQRLRKDAPRPVDHETAGTLITRARQEVKDLMVSDAWRELMQNVKRLHAELPMTGLRTDGSDDHQLLQAKADLVIEYADHRVLIVDFKTTLVTQASAPDVCQEKGYTDQVRAYMRLYQEATKHPHVDGAILFTGSKIIFALESDQAS